MKSELTAEKYERSWTWTRLESIQCTLTGIIYDRMHGEKSVTKYRDIEVLIGYSRRI